MWNSETSLLCLTLQAFERAPWRRSGYVDVQFDYVEESLAAIANESLRRTFRMKGWKPRTDTNSPMEIQELQEWKKCNAGCGGLCFGSSFDLHLCIVTHRFFRNPDFSALWMKIVRESDKLLSVENNFSVGRREKSLVVSCVDSAVLKTYICLIPGTCLWISVQLDVFRL